MDLSLSVEKGDLAFLSSFIDPAKPLMTGEINGKLAIMKSRLAIMKTKAVMGVFCPISVL